MELGRMKIPRWFRSSKSGIVRQDLNRSRFFIGDNHVALLACIIPDGLIGCAAQTKVSEVSAARKFPRDHFYQLGAHVLVEAQLHTTELATRRSRAAAKAKAA